MGCGIGVEGHRDYCIFNWGYRHKRNVVWTTLGFKLALALNRNEDGEDGGAEHYGGQWNLVWWDYDWFAGDDRNAGDDGSAISTFQGHNCLSGSVRFEWG